MINFQNIIKAIFVSLCCCFSGMVPAKDIFVVFYATYDGETGHVGLAVDNYLIHLREEYAGDERIIYYDSLKNGSLTYFDLWPAKDDIRGMKTFEYVEPKYYRLPASTSEAKITVSSLLHQGIPHKEHRPPDGLIRIRTSAELDHQLLKYAQELMIDSHPFHAIKYNCADFAGMLLEFVFAREIKAEEWVLFQKTTTPNKLYTELSAWSQATVLKDPGEKIFGKFFSERILHPKRENDIVDFHSEIIVENKIK